MKNIFHLLSALILLLIGITCITLSIIHFELSFRPFISVALSIYLIVRGITKVVNYIKSKKQNDNNQ